MINSSELKIEVFIQGIGSEFCQGSISITNYLKFIASGIDWDTFCREELELDGYWEINNIAHMTGIIDENAQLTIQIDNNS
jgi:hypothetical protein